MKPKSGYKWRTQRPRRKFEVYPPPIIPGAPPNNAYEAVIEDLRQQLAAVDLAIAVVEQLSRDSDGPRMAETQSGSGRSRTSAGRQASPETPTLKAGAPNEENDR